MATTIQDERTDEQRKRPHVLIAATDRCMSGWGGAEGGSSVAVWACNPDDMYRVERWIRNRNDMIRVRYVSKIPRGRTIAHTAVYHVDDKHPALR